MATIALLTARARADAAEEASERIHLDYSATVSCPSDAWMLRQIGAYTTKWTLAGPGEEARSFVLRIAKRDRGYVGSFDVHEPSGGTSSREIEGESCEDAALGLAVAVALAIDPRASLVPVDPPAAPPPAVEPPPTAVPASAAPAVEEKRRPVRPSPPRKPPARVDVSVGGRLEANGAVSKNLGVVSLFAEVERSTDSRRLQLLRPAIRAGFRHAFTRTIRVGEVRAEVDWNAGHVEICPARLQAASWLAIDACVGSNIGILAARALDIPGAETSRRLWVDYGPLVGARWLFHSQAFLEASAAAWIPLTRDRLRVEPDGIVTQAPLAGLSLGIGGGWRF